METLRIALAQINPTVGDLKGNREKIIKYIIQAQKIGVNIISFPELVLTGYPPEDLLLKKHFITDNLRELRTIVKCTEDIIAIVGFVDRDKKNNIYNAAGIIYNGRLKGIYHKIELPNYGVFDEKRYFQHGKNPLVFLLGSIVFGVNICEDIWKSEGVAKIQARQGAKLIINISSSPYYAGKCRERKKMLAKRAQETKTFICYNNLIGGQDELVFDGNSMILSSKGDIVAEGRQFEEDLVVADLSFFPMDRLRLNKKLRNCIRLGSLKYTKRLFLPKREFKNLNRIDEIYTALVLGTRDYIKKNGFKKAVIGLSGGIDSSLTAVIACDAIGKENITGLSMPSRYSSEETQTDAKRLANNLGIRLITVPIEEIFRIYLSVLENEFLGFPKDMTEENLQARIRSNILMAFSNKFSWLVLTTGNKSETSVGYCTLYGDMAGGFAVIKDVPKTLVYELAKFVNIREDRILIPESIFLRAPSAELKENQKDQDSLPEYSVLDAILKEYIENDKSFEQIKLSTRFDSKIIKEVIQRIDRNEYKRRQAPPGIKITPKAFGKDRRLPITNRYREW
jgi:NAD+ synthase (glutamine-hydrolysing)